MSKPNIILLMTDNQQAFTLGCYGNQETVTPHLDKFASEGFRFDKAYCPNAFCSACRASTLTGMLPSQHGVHSWIDDRNMDDWPVGWHALRGLATLPEKLKDVGYRTGIFGKYHLGETASTGPGWDKWVTMEHGHVRSFYDNKITDDGRNYVHEGHAVDFFTDQVIDFVKDDKNDQPFFAFIPFPAPYGHWPSTVEERDHRYAELYENCPMDTIPREGLSAEAVRGYDLMKAGSGGGLDFSMVLRAPNNLPSLRNYYSQISLIDEAVGRLVEAGDQAGDTIFVFTSDHGLSLGHHGFWGHGAATWPSNLHQAAHSIPMLVRHPSKIEQGQESPILVSNMDLYSTLLDYVGSDFDQDLPSRSFAGLLRGEQLADWGEDEVFSEQEETRVLRTPQWAYFRRFDGSSNWPIHDEMFDVIADPEEKKNLVGDPNHAAVAGELASRIDRFFEQQVRPEADMWKGGKPIQNSMAQYLWKDAWGEDWAPVYSYDES